uniref:Uncharacterized protein n=1 Tax=Scleropages formosus TaxID=113540 RepID=A0A8C9WEM3_SCLFO
MAGETTLRYFAKFRVFLFSNQLRLHSHTVETPCFLPCVLVTEIRTWKTGGINSARALSTALSVQRSQAAQLRSVGQNKLCDCLSSKRRGPILTYSRLARNGRSGKRASELVKS